MEAAVTARIKLSPIGHVDYGNGKIIAMNRRERRRQGLYGDKLKVQKPNPQPPDIRKLN